MEVVLDENKTATFQVKRSGTSRLGVVICWTDPKGSIVPKAIDPDTKVLINDIDLTITDTQVRFPWRASYTNGNGAWNPQNNMKNDRDNVEFVQIEAGTSSEVTVKVKFTPTSTSIGPQQVSIVIVDADAILPPFRIVEIFEGEDKYFLDWNSAVGNAYQIEASSDLNDWEIIQGEFLATGSFSITPILKAGLGDRRYFRVRQLNY